METDLTRIVGGYREFVAPAELSGWMEQSWLHRTPATGPGAIDHHLVLPYSACSLALSRTRAADGPATRWQAFLYGPADRPRRFDLLPGREQLAVQMHPEMLGLLMGRDPRPLVDELRPLAEVAPGLAGILESLPLPDADPEEDLAILVECVVSLVQDARWDRIADPEAGEPAAIAGALIRASGGRIKVADIAAGLSISARHLGRILYASAGLAPKRIAQLVRFNRALFLLDTRSDLNGAALAAECGYSDQAHMSGEFRRVTGFSPTALARQRRAQATEAVSVSSKTAVAA